jgi:hypothetical protein
LFNKHTKQLIKLELKDLHKALCYEYKNATSLEEASTLRHPQLFDGLNYNSKYENNGRKKSLSVFLGLQHFGGRRVCWSFGMGLGRMTSNSIPHMDLYKPNNKLINV